MKETLASFFVITGVLLMVYVGSASKGQQRFELHLNWTDLTIKYEGSKK